MSDNPLVLFRPLVFFDLETTGLNIGTDRIVELSYCKLFPDGKQEVETFRFNPEIPIRAEATEVHHITDEDVAPCPTFTDMAPQLKRVFDDADLAGYNSNHFDIPMLAEEFLRAGVSIDFSNKKKIDIFTIFQRHEPRTLSAAYSFYCNRTLDNAHSATADTMATFEIFKAQIARYDLPTTVNELSEPDMNADLAGRVGYDSEGKEIFNFGQYKGQRLEDIFKKNTGYYGWLMTGDFPQYTKQVFEKVFLTTLQAQKGRKK